MQTVLCVGLCYFCAKEMGIGEEKNDWEFMQGYGQEKPESIQSKRQESEICRVLSKVKQKFEAINRLQNMNSRFQNSASPLNLCSRALGAQEQGCSICHLLGAVYRALQLKPDN